jgi:hypothetical protein
VSERRVLCHSFVVLVLVHKDEAAHTAGAPPVPIFGRRSMPAAASHWWVLCHSCC